MAGEWTSSVVIVDKSNTKGDTKSSGKSMNARTVFHGRMCVDALTSLFDFTSHSSTFHRTEIIQITTLEIELQWLVHLCATSPILSLRNLPTYIVN